MKLILYIPDIHVDIIWYWKGWVNRIDFQFGDTKSAIHVAPCA